MTQGSTETTTRIEEEMKVGPKGQVVIPKVFRSALKIGPGSKVVLHLESDKVVLEKKMSIDASSEFEKIARSGRSVGRIEPHIYEEQFEERRKARR